MFKALRDEVVDTLNGPGVKHCRNLASVRRIFKMLRRLPHLATLTQVSTLNGAPVVRIECCSKEAKRSKGTIGSAAFTAILAV
jgi:hypothetical protein